MKERGLRQSEKIFDESEVLDSPNDESLINIFRREALDHYIRPRQNEGQPLKLSAKLERRLLWLLFAVIVLGAATVFLLKTILNF